MISRAQMRYFLLFLLLMALSLGGYAQGTPDTLDSATDTLVSEADTVAPPEDTVAEEPVVAAPDAEDLEAEGEVTDNEIVRFSLESPYHTILSHLYFLQDDSYFPDSAAMTLYVRDPSGSAAQKLAIELKEFMDGAGYYIDLDDIPQDRDFRDSVSGRHKYAPIPEEDEVFVYRKNNSDEWIYSYTTVKAIPDLHARVYPFGTLDWLPEWSLAKVGPLLLWQYLGLLLFLILGFLLHRILVRIIGVVLKRYLHRLVRTDSGQKFFYKVARPISLLIVFYLIYEVTPALQLPIQLNKWVILGLRISILVFWMLIALQLVTLEAVRCLKR